MQVIKRDGTKEQFDKRKIYEAIGKAFDALNWKISPHAINNVVDAVPVWDDITIEEIQDSVIETLRDFDYDKVADCYAAYRGEQSRLREIEKKIKSRGLFDTFLSEYANFILKRRKYRIEIECSAAQVADVPNHWARRFRINGMVGFINKLSYNISAAEGLNSLEVEFYVF